MNYIYFILFAVVLIYVILVESAGDVEYYSDGYIEQKPTYYHTFMVVVIGLLGFIFLGAAGLMLITVPQLLIIGYNRFN